MSYSPTDRYESASHLAADVENWLADEPVAAIVIRRWKSSAASPP